jgi:hypothetical protein
VASGPGYRIRSSVVARRRTERSRTRDGTGDYNASDVDAEIADDVAFGLVKATGNHNAARDRRQGPADVRDHRAVRHGAAAWSDNIDAAFEKVANTNWIAPIAPIAPIAIDASIEAFPASNAERVRGRTWFARRASPHRTLTVDHREVS